MIRFVIAVAAAGAAVLALAGGAFAAKPEQQLIAVDCGSDGSFSVIGNPGNGNFTPAKLADGSGVLIPVAFTNRVGTFTDNQGHTTTQPEPDVSHPTPANKHVMSCSFTASFSSPDGTFTFSGDVMAFMVPPHR